MFRWIEPIKVLKTSSIAKNYDENDPYIDLALDPLLLNNFSVA